MPMISFYMLLTISVFAFLIIWLIGARSVTQIMGSPMGASIISSKQAVLISAVSGFAGVLVSGNLVSNTYENLIFQAVAVDQTKITKALLIFVSTVFIWMFFTARRSSLFSFSYAIVSSLVASFVFSLGINSIHWILVGKIAITWLLSPILCYLFTLTVYRIFRRLMLHNSDPVSATRNVGPWAVFVFITLFSFIVYSRSISFLVESPTLYALIIVPCIVGGIFYLLSVSAMKKVPPFDEDDNNSNIAESNAERLVNPLALLIVFLLPFSLGANNVANGIGPLLIASKLGTLDMSDAFIHLRGWLLFLGGLVFLMGLIFSGFRHIKEMGRKFTELTPIRVFSMILATSLVIVIGTAFGMPLSTFHTAAGGVLVFSCITPSFTGPGKRECGRVFGSYFIPWFITVPATILIAGGLHILALLVSI